jgi:cytosine/adenosine deaminase-related metal-dependent hydrolase
MRYSSSTSIGPTCTGIVLLGAALGFVLTPVGVAAQAGTSFQEVTAVKAPPVTTQQFGDLAEGPYNRLVIRGAMVIPGHGGPPVGPYDIVIEGNVITQLSSFSPVAAERRGATERATGDRVIDATGKYVMPGLIDLHAHLRGDEMPLEYVYYLKLAHGVTTLGPAPDRGVENAMEETLRSARNEVLAPRMFPIWSWGQGVDYDRAFVNDPANAETVARAMAAKGARQVYLNGITWSRELFEAAAHAVWDAGGITGVHIPPSNTAMIQAVDAARLGVTMILHHYGYAESSLDRTVQDFPRDYNQSNENHRFREAGRVWEEANKKRLLGEVADSLVAYGVTLQPTRVVYEANRDILRATSLPWHEKYTHQALINWNLPNPAYHGSYHYDWTSDDEQSWYYAFDLWGDLIYEVNKRDGRVAYGTDDSYIWATPGFSNVRELQLIRESGMHTLEVLKTAHYNSAETLREDRIGQVRPGYLADLIIVDGNPAYNLRFLYSFGALTLDENGEMYRTAGIVHTIKDGVVIENARLMEEVARMVAESKVGVGPNAATAPFVVNR